MLDLMTVPVPDAGNKFVFTYYKAKGVTDVLLEPVWAVTLFDDWITNGILNTFVGDAGEREEWQGSLDIEPYGFIRIRATPAE